MIAIPQSVYAPGYCRGLWRTETTFIFRWRDIWYMIPPGFVFDFYSVPRPLWSIYPPRAGWGDEAALIHDFLCRFGVLIGVSRIEADRAFRAAMDHYELSFARRKWLAVAAYSLVAPEGDGTPGRKVRRAMRKRGDDWRAYRHLVVACNCQPEK